MEKCFSFKNIWSTSLRVAQGANKFLTVTNQHVTTFC